jgi:hypothetical protein
MKAAWPTVLVVGLAACTPPPGTTTPDEEKLARRVADVVYERLEADGVLDGDCRCGPGPKPEK